MATATAVLVDGTATLTVSESDFELIGLALFHLGTGFGPIVGPDGDAKYLSDESRPDVMAILDAFSNAYEVQDKEKDAANGE